MNGVALDALTAGNKLWEVKVIDFSGNRDFVVDSEVTKNFVQRDRQLTVIEACPIYSLSWAVADSRHYNRQIERSFHEPLLGHRHVPECLLLPEAP